MSLITGSRFLAKALEGHGVTHVFFVPTVGLSAMAEMQELGIQPVATHDEKAAAYMADGYARASHRPGVCLAQNVGGANLAAGLRDAYMACSAVLAITGGPDPETRYRNVYQDVEDFGMFDTVTKSNFHVDKVERLADLLRQAFRSATGGTPRPVHLRMRGRHAEILEEEGRLELVVEQDCTHYPAFRAQPSADEIWKAANVLAQAERPVLVAGGGVAASGAEREVVQLAEMLSAPVVTSLAGKGTISDSHPLSAGVVGTYSRRCANRVVAEADLVFFIASRTDMQVTNNWKIPPLDTPVIQLDIDYKEIGRNYSPRVALFGDAKMTLQAIIRASARLERKETWLRRTKELVKEWRDEAAPLANSDAVPLRPERICKEVTDCLPPDAVVVADTGHSAIWSATMLDLHHEDQRYIPCAGSLGWAFPASLGIKCALPNRPVLCFTGDGGFYYHLAELETAARFSINTVVVVNNNHSWNQEQSLFEDAYGPDHSDRSRDLWTFTEVDFAEIAEALGCVSMRVEKAGELRPALERAFSSERPVVIDAVSDISALAAAPWGQS